MTKKIVIAKVSSVFGIKGEVKIITYSNHPEKIEKYQLFDEQGNQLKIKISNKNKVAIGSSSGNPIIIAKIDGVNDRNAAEKMRGQEIFTNRANFEAPTSDEFYCVDLIGLDVLNMSSEKLGKVRNVFDYGAGSVIEVEFEKTQLKSDREKIDNFPFRSAIFPEVNLEAGFIRIDLPDIIEIEKK
jgi:16S rRNA processing protein RimM